MLTFILIFHTHNIGNTFNEEKFKLIISKIIKEEENFISTKNWMEITTDSKIVAALNSSSILSSKFN